ncbi:4-hydroxy-3-methylbut-2-enyl diphosphate reductase [Treponema sp. OMZ 855]|uniref:4-hydroxy-3-methylbut-2-enyl diphosphate reductase n=1 Tax=Treponema sp. OMZ 855 TaxID=1643512 RepID=UPI0020A2F216|nr:4-hydroxy-3-methylbut-2-enyl diphosphate reductase [Treponema sp. OMZ 855]UTC51744.1 4-hydroxy-3-methylbut-2-enyl diphosphate reductase [Treponema sp. OMZ 855]
MKFDISHHPQERHRQVKRAKVLGYCMGVRRAVEAVYRALTKYPDKTVYTYGPLIHNPVTMQLLEANGVRIVNPDEELKSQITPDSPIIIRAHGIAPQKRQELIDCGAIIIDATCPRVIASQFKAAQYSQKGYTVILAGDKNHGELIGIKGYVLSVPNGKCITVQTAAEAENVLYDGAPTVLIAQTTIKRKEYRAIAEILRNKIPDLTVLETICPATDERQEALLELVKEVEAILVIGGGNSANTRRLLQTALDSGKPAWLAESADGIPQEIYRYGTIGLAAGASTPDSSIDTIEKRLLDKPL